MQKYSGETLWHRDNNYNNNFDVKYIIYIYNKQYRHDLNVTEARRRFSKESEYMNWKLRLFNLTEAIEPHFC